MFKPIRENTTNLSNLIRIQTLKDFRRKENKTSTLIFEAKHYLESPKIILMALYSVDLNSLFPPLE